MALTINQAAGTPINQSFGLSGLQLPVQTPPSVSAGSLPPGVNLMSDGSLQGVCLVPGTYTFTGSYTDCRNVTVSTGSNTVTIAAVAAITIAGNTGVPGSAMTITPTRTGGESGGTWALVNGADKAKLLNLTLNTSTGVLTGTPAVGTPAQEPGYQFTLQYTDANNARALVDFFVKVTYATSLTVACPTPGGTHNVAYSTTATASGGHGPYVFAVASGQAALTAANLVLNPTTGVLSGTATSAGTVGPFTIQATDSWDGNTGVTGTLNITMG